jgi:hypothetical protein
MRKGCALCELSRQIVLQWLTARTHIYTQVPDQLWMADGAPSLRISRCGHRDD